jgi:hypothetical protein
MTRENFSKAHMRGIEELGSRASIQAMGLLPMVMVSSLVMY